MMVVYPAHRLSFSCFLSKNFSTLSRISGVISTMRSTVFTGGTATLTVDGLVPDSEALIYGLLYKAIKHQNLSLMTRKATGSIFTPAAVPPPKFSLGVLP